MMDSSQPQTLCDLLRSVASDYPTHGLTFVDAGVENFIPYSELLKQAHVNGNKLRDAQIVDDGKVVVVCFDNHRSNVIWTWSVIAAGGIPAVLPPLVCLLSSITMP
nr:didemethylasterriquinone d synthetase tdia [Quercus suber]